MHYPEPTSAQMNKQNCQNGITIVLKIFSPKNVNFQIPEDIKLHHVTSTYGSVFRGDDTTGFRGVSILSISEFRGDGQGNDFCRMAWSRNSINSQTNSTIYSSLLWLKQTMLFPDNQIVSQLPVQMHEFHDSRDKFKCHQKDRHKSNAIEVETPEIVFSHESKQLLQHLIWKHIPTINHSIVRKIINQYNYGKHDIKIMESNSTSWQEIMDLLMKSIRKFIFIPPSWLFHHVPELIEDQNEQQLGTL